MNLYRNESSDHKRNAQRNLEGRTHYVDPETLRFHKSKILQTRIEANGLLFTIIESSAGDMDNTFRVFRGVIFDVFGNVLDRPKLEDGSKTRKAAEKALQEALAAIDAKMATLAAIDRAERYHAQEMAEIRAKINGKG